MIQYLHALVGFVGSVGWFVWFAIASVWHVLWPMVGGAFLWEAVRNRKW